MARRRVTDEIIDDNEVNLSAILKNLGPDGGWICKVYQVGRGGAQEWLCDRAPSEISEQALAEEFGAGKFMIRPWSESLNKWAPSKTVNVSAAAQGVVMPFMQPQDNSSQLVQAQLQMQREAAAREKESSDRLMQMMMQHNQNMMQIMLGIVSSNRQPSIAELATLLKPASSNIGDIREMIALSKELVPGGAAEKDDPMMNLLTAALPAIIGGGRGASNPPAHQAQHLPPAPLPDTGTVQASKPSTEPTGLVENDEMHERKQFMMTLKRKAKEQAPIDFWADYIEVNKTDPGPAWILALVDHYTWNEIKTGLASLDTECIQEPIVSWLESLCLELQKGEEPK